MRTTLIFIYHLSVHKILFQFVIDFNTPNYIKNKICMQFAINVMYICCSQDATKIYQRDKKYSIKSSTLLPLRMLEFHPFVDEHS